MADDFVVNAEDNLPLTYPSQTALENETNSQYGSTSASLLKQESSQSFWNTHRLNIAFWICGLMNNYSYVIMLSAAEDVLPGQAVRHSCSVFFLLSLFFFLPAYLILLYHILSYMGAFFGVVLGCYFGC